MTSVRSRSWMETVRDWIPKWPNPRRDRESSLILCQSDTKDLHRQPQLHLISMMISSET